MATVTFMHKDWDCEEWLYEYDYDTNLMRCLTEECLPVGWFEGWNAEEVRDKFVKGVWIPIDEEVS